MNTTARSLRCLVLLLSCWQVAASAEGSELGTEYKLQQLISNVPAGSLLGEEGARNAAISDFSLRFKVAGSQGPWAMAVHYLLEASYSARFQELSAFNRRTAFAPEARSLLDLEDSVESGEYGVVVHRLDRASYSYTGSDWVFKLGRQAITWGNGLVFHPLDLFNPFAPDAKDTSYKPGTDLVYAQYLFPSGDDLQALLVPRKSVDDGDLSGSLSSLAFKYRGALGRLQADLLVASDYGDSLLGIGLAGPFGEALWRLDLVPVWKDEGGRALSGVVNLQHSWSWGGRPVTGFLEYYRNGVGEASLRSLAELNPSLRRRLARGQLFALGKNYLATGVQVQPSPLFDLSSTLIGKLDDASVLVLLSGRYNLSDRSNLITGAQLPLGEDGSEFGGLETFAGSGQILAPARQLFVRLEWFF